MRRVPSRAFRIATACSLLAGLLAAVPLATAAPATAAPVRPAAVSSTGGVFVPKSQRVLDTRSGQGAPAGPLGANGTVTLHLAGGAVPASGVTAVRLNVTAVSPTATTYLTVYPSGSTRPVASSLNVDAGQVLSNLVTVPLGSDGSVVFYNHAGSVHVVADLVGYDTPDTTVGAGGHVFSSLAPTRVLDTRDGTGGHLGRVGPGGVVSLQIAGRNGVPTTSVGSVLLNVTAVGPTAAGFVVTYPDGTTRPATSNLNFSAGQTVPILVIARVGSDGKVDLFNANGTVDLVADLAGYGTVTDASPDGSGRGTDGALFDPLGPTRVLDTRDGTGTGSTAPVGPDGTVSVAVAGRDGVPADATAVALNVTATAATTTTYVTVYPGGTNRPVASSLNVPAGATIANQVIVPVGPDGTVALYNHAGSVHLVADLAGYYTTGATSPWSVRVVSRPAGLPTGGALVAGVVACAGTAGCVATASVSYSETKRLAVLVTATSVGTTSVAAPLPPGVTDPTLVGTSTPDCPTAGTCLILGYYTRTNDNTVHWVLWRGFGTAWTVSPVPVPTGATPEGATGIACGPTGCVMPLAYTDPSGTIVRTTVLTGDPDTDPSTWTEQPLPSPAGTVVDLSAAGCGPAACVVLGDHQDADGVQHPYLITGSGSSWAEADAPLPPGYDGTGGPYQLLALSCAAACVIAGALNPTAESGPAVLLTGDGSSFTASIAPTPTDAEVGYYPSISAVDCPTATRCVASINYPTTSFGNTGTVLVSGWGSDLTTTPLPSPDSATNAMDYFVPACVGTSCATVGSYRDIWGVSQFATAAGTLPASTDPWAAGKVAPPPHAQLAGRVNGAACASPTFCVSPVTAYHDPGVTDLVLLTGAA
jgi:hypothetical protein